MLLPCLAAGTLLSVLLGLVAGDITQPIRITPENCGKSSMEVDAVHLFSDRVEIEATCIMKFEADEDMFMIRYDNITLPCGITLTVYYGAGAYGKVDVFNCKDAVKEPRTVLKVTKYVTIQLEKPDPIQNWNISMVLTSYKDRFITHCDEGYVCPQDFDSQDVCVDDDVLCDGVENCPDGSDELTANCMVFSSNGLAIGITIAIIIACIVACIGCIVGIVYCCRRRQNSRGQVIRQPQANVIVQPPSVPGPQAYQAPGPQGPPGYYPTGPQSQPLPPGGYQPVPAAPPGGYQSVPAGPTGQAYPPAVYNPVYPPLDSPYQGHPPPTAPYPSQGPPPAQPYPPQMKDPPPSYSSVQHVQASAPPAAAYSAEMSNVKVPL